MSDTLNVAAQALNATLQNPLQSLTFIAAPALLTNACAQLLLSTSNRFGRGVDRVRLVAKMSVIEAGDSLPRLQHRVLLLGRALIALYVAIGSFGISTFLGLMGSVGFAFGAIKELSFFTHGSLIAGSIGIIAIAAAAAHLVPETFTAYQGLMLEAKMMSKSKIFEAKEI